MITGGFIFVLGLIFGSFINAWEFRIEAHKSLWDRSFCPKCKKQIAWYDNIPLLSWLILRGKCRHCHKLISIQYPVVELLTGIVFLGIWLFSPEGISLNNYFVSIFVFQNTNLQLPIRELLLLVSNFSYFVLLLLVAIHDAKTKYVLTKHVYIAALIGLTASLLHFNKVPTWNELYPYALAIFIPFGIFWLIAKLSEERAMGFGDSDIALAVGALLGWPLILPAYYFAFIAGSIYGIYIILKQKAKLKTEVPLGPFLVAGCYFSFIYGQQIIDWYVRLVFGV